MLGLDVQRHIVPPANWVPSDHGLLAWTADPSTASSSATPAAGTLFMVKMKLPTAATVTNMIFHLTAGGSVLTAGQSLAGLYNSSRQLLSGAADQAAAWASAGVKTVALTTPQTLSAGTYYVGFFSNGTTPPTFRSGITASSASNIGLSTANSRFATADTSLTTALPSTTATLASGNFPSFWVGLS